MHPMVTSNTDRASKSPDESGLSGAISALLSGVSAHAATEASKALSLAERAQHPGLDVAIAHAQNGDLNAFHFDLLHPIEQIVTGIAHSVAPALPERAAFLLLNCRFVEGLYRESIVAAEGMACSADKSRHMLRLLMGHFKSGEPIAINRNTQYTYHLTTRVFLDHDSIVRFFDGIYALGHGCTGPFLQQLLAVRESLAAQGPGSTEGAP